MENVVENVDYQMMVKVDGKEIKFNYAGHFTVGGKPILSMIRQDNRAYFYQGQEGVTEEDTYTALKQILSEGITAQIMDCIAVGDGFYDVQCAGNGPKLRLYFEEAEENVFKFYKTEVI